MAKLSVTRPFLCSWCYLASMTEWSLNLYTFRRLSNSSRENGSNDCPVQNSTTQVVCQSSYYKPFLYCPRTDSRCKMNDVNLQYGNRSSTATEIMVTDLPRLQQPAQVTTAATGTVGCQVGMEIPTQKPIKTSPTCCVVLVNHNQ